MPSNQPFCIKVCSKCGAILVANTTNFVRKKGHKYNLHGQCKTCYKQFRKEYRQTPEYKLKHKEYMKEYGQKYRQTDKYKEKRKEYRQTDKYKEKRKEYEQKYQQTDKYKEKHKEHMKKYIQTDKFKVNNKIRKHKRRAQCKDSQGLISYEIANDVLTKWFNNRCAYSNKVLTSDTINWDHIIPLARGGVNEIWNMVPCYCKYNNSKHANEPIEWYHRQNYYNDINVSHIIRYQIQMYKKYKRSDSAPLILITGEEYDESIGRIGHDIKYMIEELKGV